MITSYSDFIKPIKKIFRSLIKADYKTIESQGWCSVEHARALIDSLREDYFNAHDTACPPRKRPEKPPKGLYWLIVPPDEEIKDHLKEALLIATLPHDAVGFPKTSEPSYLDRVDYFYHLGDVIDGEKSIPNSIWGMRFRLWSKTGRSSQNLILNASIQEHSLTFEIEDIDP